MQTQLCTTLNTQTLTHSQFKCVRLKNLIVFLIFSLTRGFNLLDLP